MPRGGRSVLSSRASPSAFMCAAIRCSSRLGSVMGAKVRLKPDRSANGPGSRSTRVRLGEC